MHTFLHRYVRGSLRLPLQPGTYSATLDSYEIDRPPHIGENCIAYINYVLQTGRLVRTRTQEFTVDP